MEPGGPLSEAGLAAAEELLARARAGEDVSAPLAALAPADAAQVKAALEAQRLVLGLSLPGGDLDGLPAPLTARLEMRGVLGRGGMGVVYLARDRAAGRDVVVKVLPADLAWNPRLLARFAREGQALLRLPAHPNLVRVHEAQAGPRPYVVMEHVAGRSLQEVLEREGPLAPEAAVRVARDVARGLAVVHRQGLVHRDLKPANVMLTPAGEVKLIDFGLAKDVFLSTMTSAGAVMGSSHYMAPEQWRGERQDGRCDIFALGATLYALLAGRPPFEGDDPAEVRDLALSGDYPPLREAVPHAPPELELVLAHLLAPALRHRATRMERVAADLDRVLRGERTSGPALEQEGGPLRLPLLPGTRWVLGRAQGCDLTIAHPTVSGEHAQVRRERDGWTIVDLRSSHGTFVGGERLAGARALRDGDRIALGDVRLVVRDPGSAANVAPYLEDVRRVAVPDWVVELLAERGDPRALTALLERLAPDPAALDEAGREVAALGPQAVAAVRDWLVREQAALAARRKDELTAASGERFADVAGWLRWWGQEGRARHPDQLVVAGRGVAPAVRLAGPGGATYAPKDGVTLLGRDPSCSVVLADPSVSRWHATLLRLDRRLVLLDAGSNAGTRLDDAPVEAAFADPGARLALGDARLTLEATPAPPDGALGPDALRALAALRHPAVAPALAALLRSEGELAAEVDGLARSLEADPPLAASLHARGAQRVQAARRLLVEVAGRDLGSAPDAWRAWAAGGPLRLR